MQAALALAERRGDSGEESMSNGEVERLETLVQSHSIVLRRPPRSPHRLPHGTVVTTSCARARHAPEHGRGRSEVHEDESERMQLAILA